MWVNKYIFELVRVGVKFRLVKGELWDLFGRIEYEEGVW